MGIHFPTDIVAGWVVGFGLWTVYAYACPLVEKHLEKLRPLSLFLLSQLVPLSLIFWQHSPSLIRIGGCAMGTGLGLFINNGCGWRLPSPSTKKEFALRALIGVSGTFLSYFLLSKLPMLYSPITMFFRFIVLGLWVATGSLLLYRIFLPATDRQLGAGKDA